MAPKVINTPLVTPRTTNPSNHANMDMLATMDPHTTDYLHCRSLLLHGNHIKSATLHLCVFILFFFCSHVNQIWNMVYDCRFEGDGLKFTIGLNNMIFLRSLY